MTITDFRPDYTTAAVSRSHGVTGPGWPASEMISDERPVALIRLVGHTTAVRERNMRQALSDLVRINNRPPGWDGLRARRLAEDAFVAAARIVVHLSRDDELRPHLVQLPGGGVQLEWHVAGNSLEIEIDRRGLPHFLAVDADGDVVLDDDPAPGRMGPDFVKAERFLDRLAGMLGAAR